MPDASVFEDAAMDAAPFDAGCEIGDDDPRFEPVESSCDGVDNDCDGIVDLLLPLGPNVCTTGAAGACGAGLAGCLDGARVCLTPPPLPEVSDGVDNDCNDVIDDVPTASVRPRLTFLVPQYLWGEAAERIETIAELLRGFGIPFDVPQEGSDWDDTLAELDQYAVAFVPGYLVSDVIHQVDRNALDRFVEGGGVLVITRPIGSTSSMALDLAGLLDATRRFDLDRITFDGEPAAPTAAFDSPEERLVLVADDPVSRPVEIYELAPDEETQVIAYASLGGMMRVPAITRRARGSGAVYALGHDLFSFDQYRCYINCFEPGRDLLALFLRDALREASLGHLALLHTVPGREDSLMMLTHDVDAPDAQLPGSWGEPGAIQMAEVEKRNGAVGTNYVTTDYITPYYSPEVVEELCALGMCPIGAHSVRHGQDFDTQELGTCEESVVDYLSETSTSSTLCGEIRVSQQLLERASGTAPRVWRTPYLYIHPLQYDVLAAQGFISDSSFAIGDFKIGVPFSLEHVEFFQDYFHRQPLFQLLISIEDGIGYYDDLGIERRIELQPAHLKRFLTNWSYVLRRNADNSAITTALIHPSYGVGVGPENLATKIEAGDLLLQDASRRGVKIDMGVDPFVEFWRARAEVSLDAIFDGSYRGSIQTGAHPIDGLTLELGDVITVFTCDPCGPAVIAGRRIVIASLQANTRYEFVATP